MMTCKGRKKPETGASDSGSGGSRTEKGENPKELGSGFRGRVNSGRSTGETWRHEGKDREEYGEQWCERAWKGKGQDVTGELR